ncbi:hypothetical protein Tco_0273805 [Tanacetum coccineum]
MFYEVFVFISSELSNSENLDVIVCLCSLRMSCSVTIRLWMESGCNTSFVPAFDVIDKQTVMDEYGFVISSRLDPVAVAAPIAVDPAGTPSSTTIDQDVPSASTLPTNQEIQSQVIHQGVEEQIHGNQNAQFDNAPLLHNLSLDLSSK